MKFLAALGLFCLAIVPALGQPLTPINLTTEYRANPMGIGEALPRLAWLLQSGNPTVRGQTQYAYEIHVASTPAVLANGRADLWDSGKVLSRMTSQIEYGGAPLGSGQACWWQVRVWNGGNEPGPWSAPAMWSAGLLQRADWKAEWIGMDTTAMGLIPPTHLVGCQWVWTDENIRAIAPRTRYFRGHFVLPEGRVIQSAFLAVTASNQFHAWVNGHHALAGRDRQILHCADVGFVLHAGENLIAISAENAGSYPALAGRLEIRFAQGSPLFVDIDAQWKSSAQAAKGWQQPAFEDLTWKHVQPLGPVGRQPWGEPTQVNLPLDPAVYLRREFLIEKKIARATIYATALGDYQLHLNGQCVSRDQLSPSFSDYRHRVYYQTYDVTSQLRLGHNALGIVLADGWYAGYWPSTHRTHNYGASPRVLAQLEIDYTDGTSVCIATDDKWRTSLGPIRQADPMIGCVYDRREELGNWDDALQKARGWILPKVGLTTPEPEIDSDPGLPLRGQEVFAAKTNCENIPGMSLVDFGKEIAGHIRLHAWATRGEVIEIQYGEELNADGSLRANRAPERDADVYVAGQTGEFTFEPSFAEHHFHYVEISGLDKKPQASQIEAISVYPDVDRTGWFVSADDELNSRANHGLWAERTQGIDAPGDHFLVSASGTYNDNLAPLYYRLLDTLSDESHIGAGGVVSSSSPLDHNVMLRDGAQDAEPIVLWELLRMYDDQRIVRRHFAELADYMSDLKAHWQDYAHHDRFFADGPGSNTEDAEMITLAYAAHVADIMSQMSLQLGNEASSEDYRRMSDDLGRQFQDRYFNIGSRSGIHTQTGYALALEWGLIPQESRADAGDQLVRGMDQDQGQNAMGDLSRSQVLFALSDSGRSDAAYRLLAKKTFVDPWTSRWLYENAGGISPAGFGFSHIRIAPHISADLHSAGAIYDSTVGRIVCTWQHDENHFRLRVSVPINCTAELDLPTSNPRTVRESGRLASGAAGIRSGRSQRGMAIYQLRSGDYDFTAVP